MPALDISSQGPLTAEEHLFLARLAALNAACEAVRAGTGARGFAEDAAAVDALLERLFSALTRSDPTPVG
jgi:hypothetical protein